LKKVDLICPGCGSTTHRETGPLVPGFLFSAGSESFQQPDYVIRECLNCFLLFKSATPSAEAFTRFYSLTDFRRWETNGFYPTEREILRVLRKLPPGSSILDFGCSSGRLLAPLVKSYRCFGIEINSHAASEAAAKGLQMISFEVFEDEPKLQLDMIVTVDVFEHLPAPTAILEKLFQHLSPGGKLLICTGDGDCLPCRRAPAEFWYLRPQEHVVMLTCRHAEWLANRLKARLVHWSNASHYDVSVGLRLRQHVQNFSYWQFRSKTWLARNVLRFMPMIRRAANWKTAPGFTCTKDHVIAVLEKSK